LTFWFLPWWDEIGGVVDLDEFKDLGGRGGGEVKFVLGW